jgi:hypothetical protein
MNTQLIKQLSTAVYQTVSAQTKNLPMDQQIDAFVLEYSKALIMECANVMTTTEKSVFAEFDRHDAATHIKKHFGL